MSGHSVESDVPITLTGPEVAAARRAVRLLALRYHMNYCQNARKGKAAQAARNLERFDEALDLYERLGGDSDTIRDPEDAPVARVLPPAGGRDHERDGGAS